MDVWNPGQYAQFKNERSQPFWDLVELVDFTGTGRLLDIGCGSGELTSALHQRHQLPYTLGIDASAKMLKAAAPLAGNGLYFSPTAVEDFATDEPFDVVISNAALQWTTGHRALFPKIL